MQIMRKVLWVLAWGLCGLSQAQVSKQSLSTPSLVKVSRGKNEADGRQWTVLIFPAAAVYQGWLATVRPELDVFCKEGSATILVLKPGFLDAAPGPRGNNFFARMRITLDDGEAEGYDWIERSDSNYQPVDPGVLQAVISSTKAIIEFRPFMVGSSIQAEFDVSGSRREISKYPECRVPEIDH